MFQYPVSEDAKAIALLTVYLDSAAPYKPLNISEYNRVVRSLVRLGAAPADLMTGTCLIDTAKDANVDPERLKYLVSRGVSLGFALENWQRSGLWMVGRSDAAYPKRMKEHLKENAPAILFGAGDLSLADRPAIGVVGSRNVDEDGQQYTAAFAEWAVHSGRAVVSGAARGVDSIAMNAAIHHGGSAIGLLAENLLRKSLASDTLSALYSGNLLLISSYHPAARFSVGNAMGRNKQIYAMADLTAVISSDHKKGGTWSGAVEELKRPRSKPVFVRTGANTPKGNAALLLLGAKELPPQFITGSVEDLLQLNDMKKQIEHATGRKTYTNMDLFETAVSPQVREDNSKN